MINIDRLAKPEAQRGIEIDHRDIHKRNRTTHFHLPRGEQVAANRAPEILREASAAVCLTHRMQDQTTANMRNKTRHLAAIEQAKDAAFGVQLAQPVFIATVGARGGYIEITVKAAV